MRLLNLLTLRVQSLFGRKRLNEQLDDEIRFHLDQQIEENIAAGMSPTEARYAAMRTTGGITQIQEECRDMRKTAWFENSLQDLKYAIRGLSKTPPFTCVAILSLALGIGANTAVFSIVHAVLIRSLPYSDPASLARLIHSADGADWSNMPEFEFVREHATAFSSVAAQQGGQDVKLALNGNVETIRVTNVSTRFFETLGVPLDRGREFANAETLNGGPRAIIISAGMWRRLLQSDPSIVGRVLTIGGAGFQVAGILPESLWTPEPADAFLPLRSTDEGYNTSVFARLKPGVSLQQANSELIALTAAYRKDHPELTKAGFTGLAITEYQRWLVGDVRTNLLLLFGAVILLLAIACSNLASLLFARLTARQREIAVRLALGSSTGRLARLFIIENALLVLAGAGTGVLAAWWSLNAMLHLFPYKLPAAGPVGLDLTVLTFTFSVAAFTGLIFSLVPMLMSSRIKVDQALKSGRSQTTGIRQRIRSVLVVGEVAMATAMLVAAALLIVSLYRQHHERLGFDARNIMTFRTPATDERAGKPVALRQFEASLNERIRTIPGVRNIGLINVLPLVSQSNYPVQQEGHPEHSIGGMEIRVVSPTYFETMGIPIVRGRGFNDTDAAGAAPVVLVNETVMRQWWPDAKFLGDRVQIGRFQGRVVMDEDPPREVVGIVADTKTVELKQKPRPTLYMPVAQRDWEYGLGWVVRADPSTGLSPALLRQLRQAVADIDPHQRVTQFQPMEEIVSKTMADSRFDAWLFGIFAGVALLLTAIGVYGLLAFFVVQRTSEIGIRLALGSTRSGVLTLVLRQSVMLIAGGLVAGLAGALALTRLFAKLLFGVSATDPWTFATVAIVLLVVGIAASLIPARRALRIDPMVALRYE